MKLLRLNALPSNTQLEKTEGYDAPPRISSLREKVEYLTELGVDYIAVAKFDNSFRSLSAEQFADILKEKLNAQSLVLGDDFHFGKNRQGNSEFLENYGFGAGCSVIRAPL